MKMKCSMLNRIRIGGLPNCVRWCSLQSGVIKDAEKYFIRPDVQSILKKITGFNLDKIFIQQKICDVEPPKYRLLTAHQLEAYKTSACEHGIELLQMPPAKSTWRTNIQALCVDGIADFEKKNCHYVFTDITYGLPHRQRVVIVRESDGILRLSSREEHDRILHVYYPRSGKMYTMPKMFLEENLENILSEHRYLYVLDRACVQFEPDDPNYIRVSQRTYEHIANEGYFNVLRSTRHFGPMAFYLAVNKRMDGLIIDMLLHGLLTDASSLIKLFHILHPHCKSAIEIQKRKQLDPLLIIEIYVNLDAVNPGAIELALQSINGFHQPSDVMPIVA
jgi:small subunit ribosomal protein S22